jgi:hypothetical protein
MQAPRRRGSSISAGERGCWDAVHPGSCPHRAAIPHAPAVLCCGCYSPAARSTSAAVVQVLLILAVLIIMPRSGPEAATYRLLTTSESKEELPTLTKVGLTPCSTAVHAALQYMSLWTA